MFKNLLFIILFSVSFIANAKDFKTPHNLKPGDVISADLMNELFHYIANSKAELTTISLLGSWSCTSYLNNTSTSAAMSAAGVISTYTLVDGWYATQNNGNITFIDDGDGTFSLTTTKTPFLYRTIYQGVQPFHYKVVNGFLAIQFNDPVYTGALWYTIKQISEDRMLFYSLSDSFTASIVLCDKNNLPPENPETLTQTTSGTNVTLSWLDKSTNELNFSIMRKDSLNGNWVEINTVLNNTITYVDSSLPSGTYWYRIKSKNNNGSSLGTNVIKITIP